MTIRTLLVACALFFLISSLQAQERVIVLEGGAAMDGVIEATINSDTLVSGERVDPNTVYELKRGTFYVVNAAIKVKNPEGMLTLRAEAGEGSKPIIIRVPKDEVPIRTHEIEGGLCLQGLQYHSMQTDGVILWNQFNLSGDDSELLVEDCLFENLSGVLFRADDVNLGLNATIRNCYFRDFHDGVQWWGGRILDCRVPVDTLIFENNTTTGCGLTVLSQQSMVAFGFINHNTFINNTKYPFLNQAWKEVYYTNNLFVNANWVGEDRENVVSGAQDPDALFHGLVGVDTISLTQKIHPRYLINDGTALGNEIDEISDYIWYAADNVCVSSTTLDAYYGGEPNDGISGAPSSYLTWAGLGSGPWQVINVPGNFMNERATQLIEDWDNIKAENNIVYEFSAEDMGFGTDPLPQAAADVYIDWNRYNWEVPDVMKPDIQETRFGDYDPSTVPGVETESAMSGDGGITKISDMLEDFSYSKSLISKSDGLPIGALHWDDLVYDEDASLAAVKVAYEGSCEFSGLVDASITRETCPGLEDGAIDITVSGPAAPYTYIWSNGALSEDLQDLPYGEYSVRVTGADACSHTESYVVAFDTAKIVFENVVITAPGCPGGTDGSISLELSGTYLPLTYQWSNGAATSDIDNLSSGGYEVIITDALGCVKSDSVWLYDPEAMLVSADVSEPTCYGHGDGIIRLEVSGGQEPYQFAWFDGSTEDSIPNLTAGCYTVDVTDDNGCAQEERICVPDSPELVLSLSGRDNLCFGDSSGMIYASASGGTPGYTFIWVDEDAQEANGNLPAGKYLMTVLDANDCITLDSIELIDPEKTMISDIIGAHQVVNYQTYTYSVTDQPGMVFYWQVEGGNVISGQESNVVVIHWGSGPEGQVRTVAESALGCSSDSSLLEVLIGETGLSVSEADGFSIYPNPAHHMLRVICNVSGEYTIELTTLNGTLLMERNSTDLEYKLDISALESGIYLMNIKSGDFLSTQKLVKY